MKQRLKLASAIIHDPKLLILDEPTNGLDPKGRDEMLELARDLSHNKGMSILFSSHLLPDVESVCDRILVMGRGRLLAEGKLADLKERHEAAFQVRVKHDAGLLVEQLTRRGCKSTSIDDALEVRLPTGATERVVWQAAADVGVQIRFLRPRQGTLEEVFMKALEE
jgi:ABC-2 type transport system ATP-binding protein